MPFRRLYSTLAAAALAATSLASFADDKPVGDAPAGAAALKQKFEQIRPRLEKNAFGRPLHLDAADAPGRLKGDVYAILDHPFARVQEGFTRSSQWCEVLTLPFNVQRCDHDGGEALTVRIGRTPQSPIEEATKLDFRYAADARAADYMRVRLTAPSGPAGTRDYRIMFEATPLDAKRTLVHMHYGYSTGAMSKIAMKTYLSTSGADKVGFSSEGTDDQGNPKLVGGMRGVMERNTMRYFLAIDAYLDTLVQPKDRRLRARLDKWFGSTERYARQLREMSREEYLALKTNAAGKAG